jgi:hypothetical protein
MSESFTDIRQQVTSALASVDDDKGKDLAVNDLGPDWVVYSDPDTDGPGLFKRSYERDSSGHVKFTSAPVKVSRTTSYNEMDSTKDQPKDLKEAAVKVREHFRRLRREASQNK